MPRAASPTTQDVLAAKKRLLALVKPGTTIYTRPVHKFGDWASIRLYYVANERLVDITQDAATACGITTDRYRGVRYTSTQHDHEQEFVAYLVHELFGPNAEVLFQSI